MRPAHPEVSIPASEVDPPIRRIARTRLGRDRHRVARVVHDLRVRPLRLLSFFATRQRLRLGLQRRRELLRLRGLGLERRCDMVADGGDRVRLERRVRQHLLHPPRFSRRQLGPSLGPENHGLVLPPGAHAFPRDLPERGLQRGEVRERGAHPLLLPALLHLICGGDAYLLQELRPLRDLPLLVPRQR